MARKSVKGMSRYEVLHELSMIAGWTYEGPIQDAGDGAPRGSGYRHPDGEVSLITPEGEVYIRDRLRPNVWHEARWVNRKATDELKKELSGLQKELKTGK